MKAYRATDDYRAYKREDERVRYLRFRLENGKAYQDRLAYKRRYNNEERRAAYNALRREQRAERNRMKETLKDRAGRSEGLWQPFTVPDYLK